MDIPSTGLYWADGTPFLATTGEPVPMGPGATVRVAVEGPRSCVGHWRRGAGRRACPFTAPIEPGAVDAQCVACGNADAGRQVARDRAVDDGSPYRLYLAWFGDETIKVGICSAGRGTNRLTEQGALAYAFVADGTLGPIRAAERAVSAAGIAVERVRSDRKPRLWWSARPDAGRARLTAAAERVGVVLAGRDGVIAADVDIVHQDALFGVDDALPASFRPLSGIAAGDVVSGTVRAVAGRSLLFVDGSGATLVDGRLFAGWRIAETDAETTRPRLGMPEHPETTVASQPTLF